MMRQKVTVERVTCDLCGQDIRYSTGLWKEVILNDHASEMCAICGRAFEQVSDYMRNELNVTVVIKPLEWDGDE